MTAGHRHRTVRVKRDGWLDRALRIPTLWHSTNYDWIDRSRLVFGPCDDVGYCWRLSPLGLLHGLIGLTLEVRDE